MIILPEVIVHLRTEASLWLHAPHACVVGSVYWVEHYEGYQQKIRNMVLIFPR
jgi:hypothetical protein